MSYLRYLMLILISYLAGSFNFAIICSKLFKNSDVRDFGSGNAGMTNYLRVYGGNLTTLFVIAGDIGKCFLAVFIGNLMFGSAGRLIAGFFVMIGHLFPLYFKFKGGKGVLTSAATFFAFDWRIFLICFVLFVIIVAATRFISLASICAACITPVLSYFFYDGNIFYVIVSALIAAIITFMHRGNIKRLINKTESKFSFKPTKIK